MDEVELGQHSTPPLPEPSHGSKIAPDISSRAPMQQGATVTTYQIIRALDISCRIGGLIFQKNFAAKGCKRHLHASLVYSFILLLFLTTNIFPWLTMFHGNEVFGSILFIEITYCVWSLQTLGHFMACYIGNESYERVPVFFH